MVNELIYELFGIFGGILGVVFIPQLFKTFKTKSVKDLSYSTWILITLNVLFWSIYGFYKNDLIIIVPNIISFFITITILVFIRRYSNV